MIKRLCSKGLSFILILIVISTLTVLGGTLLLMVHNRVLLVQIEMDRTKAFFIAEAGISQSIFELKSQIDQHGDGVGNISRQSFGEGYFQVIHLASTGEIRSTGTVNSISRTVQIQYVSN